MKTFILILPILIYSYSFAESDLEKQNKPCPNLSGKYQLIHTPLDGDGYPKVVESKEIKQDGCDSITLITTALNDQSSSTLKINITGKQYVEKDEQGKPHNHMKATWTTTGSLKLEYDYTGEEPSTGNTAIQVMSKDSDGHLILDFALVIAKTGKQIRIPFLYVSTDDSGNAIKLTPAQ